MFHKSQGDNQRQWHSRTLGYDKGGVGSLLSHDAPAITPQPQPEHAALRDNVRGTFRPDLQQGIPTDTAAPLYGRRATGEIAQKARARGSEMDLAMHGIASEARGGLGHAQGRGGDMHALMSGEPAATELALDDPFAHVRGGGRRRPAAQNYPNDPLAIINADLGRYQAPPSYGVPAGASSGATADDLVRAVNSAYDAVMHAVASAPRDPDGSLSDYGFILTILHSYGLDLTTDGAGTLIASCDVRGGITFDEFLECLGLAQPSGPPPATNERTQQTRHEPVAPASAPTWTAAGGSDRLHGLRAPATAAPHTIRDMATVGATSASLELGRLLNGDPRQNARRSNLANATTGGKSPRDGSTGGRIFG